MTFATGMMMCAMSVLAWPYDDVQAPRVAPRASAPPAVRLPARHDPVDDSTALPLPLPESSRKVDEAIQIPNPSFELPKAPVDQPVDPGLSRGRTIDPIDLLSVLRLAGERDIDIAVARQRITQSLAELQRTRALWLPSIFIGPTYYRADGQVQTVTGEVINVNRSSLFLGATATLPNGFPAPAAGTGYPQLNSLSSILRISDTIFEPLVAKRLVAASRASLQANANDAILRAAEAYLDLQLASGRLAIAHEAEDNAERLATIAGDYARAGQGVEADHRRALAEYRRQRRIVQAASGELLVASTNLTRLLVLDAKGLFAPLEPAEMVLRLVPDEAPVEDLIVQALENRPEMAQSKEMLRASVYRAKQARLRPFVPSVSVTYAGGGQGGGPDGFFGNFGSRGDFMASLFWEFHHLGVADVAAMRRTAAEKNVADLELLRVSTRVSADVAASHEQSITAAGQIEESKEAVLEAIESIKLNFTNLTAGAGLPRAPRPIEVLQPIQALAQARIDYLESVLAYNRAQLRLKRALGQQP